MRRNVAQFAEPKCPVCGEPRKPKYRPFCSRRCADIDLGRWFTGAYAIPTEEIPDEFDIGSAESGRDDGEY